MKYTGSPINPYEINEESDARADYQLPATQLYYYVYARNTRKWRRWNVVYWEPYVSPKGLKCISVTINIRNADGELEEVKAASCLLEWFLKMQFQDFVDFTEMEIGENIEQKKKRRRRRKKANTQTGRK